jgi:DNA-binding transcriptional ArsR family regulator
MLNRSADALFQALGDPTRRRMVELLSRGSASVGDLAKPLSLSLPAVMQHLRLLEESGLVRSEKVGRVRSCHLQPKALSAAEQWLAQRRTSCERRLDRLAQYLAAHPEEPEDVEAPPKRRKS